MHRQCSCLVFKKKKEHTQLEEPEKHGRGRRSHGATHRQGRRIWCSTGTKWGKSISDICTAMNLWMLPSEFGKCLMGDLFTILGRILDKIIWVFFPFHSKYSCRHALSSPSWMHWITLHVSTWGLIVRSWDWYTRYRSAEPVSKRYMAFYKSRTCSGSKKKKIHSPQMSIVNR